MPNARTVHALVRLQLVTTLRAIQTLCIQTLTSSLMPDASASAMSKANRLSRKTSLAHRLVKEIRKRRQAEKDAKKEQEKKEKQDGTPILHMHVVCAF